MPPRLGQLVGRARELAELDAGLRAAAAGRGGVWLLSGEAGIGKSRLCEEVARRAPDAGLQAYWGRCWEAGGAPAYWPWLQVLRALWPAHAEADGSPPTWARVHGDALVQLLPERMPKEAGAGRGSLPPEQARFVLLDGLCAALTAAARAEPALLVLEDLHVADEASLAALEILSSQVRSAPLMVLGTYRDSGTYPAGQVLASLSHRTQTLPLGRLPLEDVRDYLQTQLAGTVDEAVQRVQALSEGHPLYLVECVRHATRHGAGALSAPALARDTSLAHLLRERLSAVDAETRAMLEVLSVVGREASRPLLTALLAGAELSPLAHKALDAALIEEPAVDVLRFSHVLVREALYQGLSPERRRALHARVAAELEAGRVPDAAGAAQLAHHLRHAGEQARERAFTVTLAAARHDLETLAFASAAEGFEGALELLDPGADGARAPLLLELARAELGAGRADRGQAHAQAAAQLFRDLEDVEGFAEAALSRGSLLRFGYVDVELLDLLHEANRRLGEQPSTAKARVLARLAAAGQPSLDYQRSAALAREAIEMARALGDERLLLDVLFTASSALVDLVDARERATINREHAALAERLGDPVHALRAHTRLVFDCFELGDFSTVRASTLRAAHHAARLNHPLFAWVPLALQGAQALYEGAAERARTNVEKLDAFAGDTPHPDPNFAGARWWQRARLARLLGDEAAHERALLALAELFEGGPQSDWLVRLFVLTERLYTAPRELEVEFSPSDARMILQLGDCTALLPLSQWAFVRGEVEVAAEVEARLATLSHTHTGMGVMTMVWDGPLGLARGLLALLVHDDAGAAQGHFEAAFALALEHGGEPAAARIALWWTRAFERSGRALAAEPLGEAVARASNLAAEPVVLAELRAWQARSGGASAEAPLPSQPVPGFSLTRDGEHYRLRVGERDVAALRDTKGVRWLATLVAEPGRSFHVLTLSGEGGAPAAAHLGDAGTVLDAEAVVAYRRRLRDLEQAHAEAEQNQDLGRLQRIVEEQEALHDQLSAAVGAGGRLRRDKSATERARTNVQRRLKDAIRRVAEVDAGLGRHLERCVRTGVHCVYDPA